VHSLLSSKKDKDFQRLIALNLKRTELLSSELITKLQTKTDAFI